MILTPHKILLTKSRAISYGGHMTGIWWKKYASKVLVGKSEVKRPLGRPRSRWKSNIKMHLKQDL
jgi:hypothetical protein